MKAAAHELRLQLAAHPLAYPVVRVLGRLGPAVRVPGLGVVVNEAAAAREVLTDTETFRSGGGTEADLWTPVFGPSMLVNMDGPEHRAMRRKLAEFFTPAYVRQLVDAACTEPLARTAEALRAGRPVDVVRTTKIVAGAVTSALVGFTVTGSTAEREAAYLRMTGQATAIIGLVKLGKLSLSDRQIARARAIVAEIGATTSLAWEKGDETTAVGRMRSFGLTEDEARGLASAFLIAGTETITSLLPRMVAVLHDHGALAGVAAAYRDGDTRPMEAAIHETARLITPAPIILRNAVRSGRIGGVAVRAGDRVVLSTLNCARAHGRFDLARPHPPELRRLWFGAGPHFCLGYPLAMAEIHAILGTLAGPAALRITARRAAPGVLFPAYRRLEVSRA
ncbi:cytochrome P450 [Amycolatopsis mediterranei S699]|uniref:Cytochrome P450 n=2 Tax=Amycolatopsis mediterranei TaxID=33910 RepID=A0A0H3D6U5_AMYMU|nr:cytochrome P450 [Amycolatopsis mediterranei]ADJ45788.1 cytochrome P450 [Amycolatopsis mediterranei U32]AEK42569.1 cytochrome P450 [Amycolatopsis mediterranei S699]AFO77499.1 cytochrome P450 [Amycolatopsis mediterranei S699]AGT84627.1 cytochrome P450 [Amycolatopsis mediterranei RB]KDO05324.1 cytochrome P450 [Amycolatopsis mediterranei]